MQEKVVRINRRFACKKEKELILRLYGIENNIEDCEIRKYSDTTEIHTVCIKCLGLTIRTLEEFNECQQCNECFVKKNYLQRYIDKVHQKAIETHTKWDASKKPTPIDHLFVTIGQENEENSAKNIATQIKETFPCVDDYSTREMLDEYLGETINSNTEIAAQCTCCDGFFQTTIGELSRGNYTKNAWCDFCTVSENCQEHEIVTEIMEEINQAEFDTKI